MKTALVFGAAGGIGRGLTSALKQHDFRVLAVARDETTLDGVEATSADLADDAQVAAACLWAAQQGSPVDLLVFAAGRMGQGSLGETDGATFQRLWADNALAAQLVHRHATPLLAPEGHRVFLGAYVDKLNFPKLGAYAAAKAALDAWARVLIREERKVKTTLLRLPAVDTPLWKQAPFPLPKGALTPAQVADEVLACFREGKVGVVDVGGS